MSFRSRLFALIVVLVGGAAAISVYLVFSTLREFSARDVDERAAGALATTTFALESVGRANELLADTLVRQAPFVDSVAAGDRVALQALLGDAYAHGRANGQVDQLHIHGADRRTLLRLHNPSQAGDDVTTFRPLVRSVFETKTKVVGLEPGLNGTAIRAIVPVIDRAGALVGVVEIGSFINDRLLKRIKPEGVELSIWRANTEGPLYVPGAGPFLRLGGTTAGSALAIDARDLATIEGGNRVSRKGGSDRAPSLQLVCAMLWRGTPTGAILEIAIDLTAQEELVAFLTRNIFATSTVVVVGLLVAVWVALRRYVSPIDRIVDVLNEFAAGNLSKRTPLIDAPGRTGDLARSVEGFRQMSIRLSAAIEQARHANAAKTDFLANFSHELRTPLNAIIGFSDIMRNQTLGPLPERYSGYSADIHDAAGHLLKVVSDIIDLQRIEKGTVDTDREPTDIVQVVMGCVRLLAILAEARKITIRTVLPAGPAVVETDAQRVGQVVINLLSNAIKYSHPGGTVVVEVAVQADGRVAVRVIDEGFGMTPEELALALQPFGHRAMVRRRTQDSIGLGLPIVRGLVEALAGTLTIESETDRGTTATVVLGSASA